jgi:tetratricopeptide (TPR) repeat protein
VARPPDDDVTQDSAGGRASIHPTGRVGRYVILSRLGAGGMGVVYSAYDDELDRRVALKLINPHGSPTAAQNRLVREARTMAKLQHPHVVAVYDAQTVGDAIYVAMELVPGVDVRGWLAAGGRTLAEIVAVFVQAGRGLAAAHAAGIVHRDFKPANVLVGDDGRTRVADFGLALALGADAPDEPGGDAAGDAGSSRVTRDGERVGTPAYMSPEQHRGEAATSLSDQFSFCVSLHEAACGERPFTIAELEAGELPPPPAPGAPAWLRAILARGLRREPRDRFPSMGALLRDLDRDPGARRRRWALAAGAATIAGTIAWAIATRTAAEPCGGAANRLRGAWDGAIKARVHDAFRATGVAYAEAAWLGAADALDQYAAHWTAAHVDACRATRVRGEQTEDALARRMACLDQRRQSLSATARVLAAADAEIVERAVRAARALPAIAACDDVASLLAEVAPPEDPVAVGRVDDARGKLAEARALFEAGKYERALAIVAPTAAAAKTVQHAPLVADTELLLGKTLDELDRYPDAEAAFYEAVFAGEAGRHERAVADAWIDLVWMEGVRLGRADETARAARFADAALLRLGDPPDLRARYWSYLGSVATAQRKPDEAEAAFKKALAILEGAGAPDELRVDDLRFNLATAALLKGRFAEALAGFRRVAAASAVAYGPDHPHTARAWHAVGNALLKLERNAEAAEAYARAATARERALGPDHADLGNSLNGWANALALLGRSDEALDKYRRSLAIKEKGLAPDDPKIANTVANIGSLYSNKGDPDAARPYLLRALAMRETKWGAEHPDVVDSLEKLAMMESRAGRYADALAYARRATTIGDKVLPADHPELGSAWYRLGEAYLGLGQRDKARQALERALAVYDKGNAPATQTSRARELLARSTP